MLICYRLSGNSSSNYADQHVDDKNELVDCDTDTKPINNHKENESNETIENLSTKHKEEFDLKESILLKRLIEVQNRKQEKCLTEEDLIRRIDYLEEQEKLNDELDR